MVATTEGGEQLGTSTRSSASGMGGGVGGDSGGGTVPSQAATTSAHSYVPIELTAPRDRPNFASSETATSTIVAGSEATTLAGRDNSVDGDTAPNDGISTLAGMEVDGPIPVGVSGRRSGSIPSAGVGVRGTSTAGTTSGRLPVNVGGGDDAASGLGELGGLGEGPPLPPPAVPMRTNAGIDGNECREPAAVAPRSGSFEKDYVSDLLDDPSGAVRRGSLGSAGGGRSEPPVRRSSLGSEIGEGRPEPPAVRRFSLGSSIPVGPVVRRLSASQGINEFGGTDVQQPGAASVAAGAVASAVAVEVPDDGVTVLSMGSVGEKMVRNMALQQAAQEEARRQRDAAAMVEEEVQRNLIDPLGGFAHLGIPAVPSGAEEAAASVASAAAGGLTNRGMRAAARQPWLQHPSVRDDRMANPSTVEVDVFATPYEPDLDLPSGFAERRMAEEQRRLAELAAQPLYAPLPEGHPDRDDTGGAGRYYLSPDQVALLEEDARMSPRAVKLTKACTLLGVIGFVGASIYAMTEVNGVGLDPTFLDRAASQQPPFPGEIRSDGVVDAGYTPTGTAYNGAGTKGSNNMESRAANPTILTGYGESTSSSGGALLPAKIDSAFKDMNSGYDMWKGDVPFHWLVPMTGGMGVEAAFSRCLGLVQASEVGCKTGHCGEGEGLKIVDIYGEQYVNVDLSHPDGITRAVELELAKKGIADIIHSPRLHNAADLFLHDIHDTPNLPRGRLFVSFRHPIDRAVASYFYVRSHAATIPEDFPTNIAEYAASAYVENNLVTRLLIDKPRGDLSLDDANQAQEILRRKCLVGLYDNLAESVWRYRAYFGLNSGTNGQDACVLNEVQAVRDKIDVQRPNQKSQAYQLLLQQNHYDVMVYDYAKDLYDYQGGAMLGHR